jgi:hypothetical protein
LSQQDFVGSGSQLPIILANFGILFDLGRGNVVQKRENGGRQLADGGRKEDQQLCNACLGEGPVFAGDRVYFYQGQVIKDTMLSCALSRAIA